MTRRLRALRVVHPFPSFLNTALVFALAEVAGANLATAALLALGMLGLQFCVGATNDLVDEQLDRAAKPWKPVPAGLISAESAGYLAASCAFVGLTAAALTGGVPYVLWCVMLGAGLLYDLLLKPTPVAWACYSVAFACLPIYAWFGATNALPPQPQLVVLIAVLAGPTLNLSNNLVDMDQDRAAGARNLATRLGRRLSLAAIGVLLVVIHGAAWLTLSSLSGRINPWLAAGSVLAIAGLALSARLATRERQIGWSLQAVSICLVAVGWLSAVV